MENIKTNKATIEQKKNESLKNLDFFLIDSFENIKNLQTIKTPSSDTIFLFYYNDKIINEKISKIKQDLYNRKDLEKNYYFIILYYKILSLGILFPQEKFNNYKKLGVDEGKNILEEIQKSNLTLEMKNKFKIDLRNNKFILSKIKCLNIDNNEEINYTLQFEIKNNNKIINEQKNIDNNTNETHNIITNNPNIYLFSKIGLKNIGSTCYMNSTLQILIHINELTTYFLNEYPNDWQILFEKNKNVESKGNISKSFYKLISGIYNNNPNIDSFETDSSSIQNNKNKSKSDFTSFSPNEFKKTLGMYNSQFRSFEANDSKDLILYLLRTIHEELNYLGDKSPPKMNQPSQLDKLNSFYYFNMIYNSQNLSKISVIFYGTYENTTTCKVCKNIYYNFQKFECISFGMYGYSGKKFNIYDGFKDNEKPQILKGDNKFFCNFCKKFCEGEIKCKIFQHPHKLLINIDYGKNKKYKPSNIEFEEEIDITKYVNFNFGCKIKYKIIGVCSHYGSSGKSGHYVAYCKHRTSGKWYKFNDSVCTPCEKEEYRRGSPYLLLYELSIL